MVHTGNPGGPTSLKNRVVKTPNNASARQNERDYRLQNDEQHENRQAGHPPDPSADLPKC